MSISQLLRCNLPPTSDGINNMDINFDFFDSVEPAKDIEDVLPFLAIPTRTMLDTMHQELGQAWFDGKKSIHTWINPEIAYPFSTLTYWGEMLDACESKNREVASHWPGSSHSSPHAIRATGWLPVARRNLSNAWLCAETWLDQRGKTDEEVTLKLTVCGLWSVLKWHGSRAAFGYVQVIRIAILFSSEYLGTDIVDALLAVLAFRLPLSDNAKSQNSLIVDTKISSFLTMLLPIIDGVATGPICASGGGQAYLKKYAAWFHDKDHWYFHLVLYCPPKHWTACFLDFSTHKARYGDSLGWEQPKNFFGATQVWLNEHDHLKFMVTDDLPCMEQTDRFNCGIIAVNTIAHNALGDPLWTPKKAKALCMRAFCNIVKHTLSAKKIDQPTRVTDPNNYADNILAVNPDFNDVLLASMVNAAEGDLPAAKLQRKLRPRRLPFGEGRDKQ
ncbi:hypothetical protein B0H19DRAFT_1249041 [Mycena capillaripes]|nr:hypothetical protein B0H19DRAFT_1249041 [Mycena capillaripes]